MNEIKVASQMLDSDFTMTNAKNGIGSTISDLDDKCTLNILLSTNQMNVHVTLKICVLKFNTMPFLTQTWYLRYKCAR